MFSAISLNEALHSYAFHLSMKTNVKRSRQGEHKTEAKNIACKRQSVTSLFTDIIMASHAYCLYVTSTLFLTVPDLMLSKFQPQILRK